MAPSQVRRILVTGATGNQGSAVIDALLQCPSASSFEILALTRNTSSAKAKALAAKSNTISLLRGDFDDCDAIFQSSPGPISTVYSVQINFFGSEEKTNQERVQGNAMIDAALAHGVKHFVQASGDRGGSERSEVDATNVPHFATKFDIEKHLMQKAGGKMTWTILRPVSFMDNYTADFQGKGFAAMWANIGDKPLQMISTKDIGIFAAMAIEDPESPIFKNKALSIAGDELTQRQACDIYRSIFGHHMPTTLGLIGSVVQWKVPELKLMFKWFKEVGFGADVAECRTIHPGLQDWRKWLEESSAFRK